MEKRSDLTLLFTVKIHGFINKVQEKNELTRGLQIIYFKGQEQDFMLFG